MNHQIVENNPNTKNKESVLWNVERRKDDAERL